ncbi:MAG: type II secretion system minor pseudopilin GspI [Sphingomonadales bacterium]|nr:type II secretion system minor pseudopilin GspI [Sphingomonadales bacterium]
MTRRTTGFGPSLRSAEHGFTLIEMLVALSVFAIAALALLRLDAYAVATAADLSGKAAAQLVAENSAALIASDPAAPLRGGSRTTVANGGRSFVVAQRVAPTDDARLVRIDIAVSEVGGTGRAGLTLVKRVS